MEGRGVILLRVQAYGLLVLVLLLSDSGKCYEFAVKHIHGTWSVSSIGAGPHSFSVLPQHHAEVDMLPSDKTVQDNAGFWAVGKGRTGWGELGLGTE